MTTNLYAVRDLVSHKLIIVGAADTDGEFVREFFPTLRAVGKRLEDLQYFRVAEMDVSSFNITAISPVLCDVNAYKFPEVQSRQLTAEEIEKLAAQIAANKRK